MRVSIIITLFVILVGVVFFLRPHQSQPSFPPQLPSPTPEITFTPQSDVIFHGTRKNKVVALTFDADMMPKMKKDLQEKKVESWYNKKVIDVLQNTQTKATLFLTGMWIELYPKETQELAKNPLFELGNHSYSHPGFTDPCYTLGTIPDAQDKEQIQKTNDLLFSVAQVRTHFFRFPGGCYAQEDLDIARELKMTVVQWDVSSGDAFSNNKDALVRRVLQHTQNGSIVVFHLHGNKNAPETAHALPEIIDGLKKRGFTFVKVSELEI